MRKYSEASAAVQARWRKHEEGRKHTLGHILGAPGDPGQAPKSLKDLGLKKRRSFLILSSDPGGLGGGNVRMCVVVGGDGRRVGRGTCKRSLEINSNLTWAWM